MLRFKKFYVKSLNEDLISKSLNEQLDLPDEVLSGFTSEINTKKSTSRRMELG